MEEPSRCGRLATLTVEALSSAMETAFPQPPSVSSGPSCFWRLSSSFRNSETMGAPRAAISHVIPCR